MKLTRRRLKWFAVILVGLPIVIYAVSAANYISKCSPARVSCLEHRKAGCGIDGEYNIKLGSSISEATCDMTTESGGWTLVANYLHRGVGTQDIGPLLLEVGKFPIQDQHILGLDERGKKSWGHVSNRVLSVIPFQELRFKCRTSAHERLLDVAVNDQACLDYFRQGIGACIKNEDDKASLQKNSRGLAGNEGRLLRVADKGWKDQGDSAIVNYPFFSDYGAHWSVGASQNRFECDDYDSGGKTNTHHQVWIR